jgi:hypothetical protein
MRNSLVYDFYQYTPRWVFLVMAAIGLPFALYLGGWLVFCIVDANINSISEAAFSVGVLAWGITWNVRMYLRRRTEEPVDRCVPMPKSPLVSNGE